MLITYIKSCARHESGFTIMKNANVILVILSFLIPIVGIVLYFVKKNDEAEAAKSYLWAAVAGFVLALLLL